MSSDSDDFNDSSSDDFENTDEYRLGEAGERLVEEFLQRCLWATIPKRKYAGEGAPMLEGTDVQTILPDIEAVKDGETRYVEVKTKSTYHVQRNKDNEKRHGIGFRSWRHYCDIQRDTGNEVWLFIYEVDTGTLCCASLDKLSDAIVKLIQYGDSGYEAYGEEMIIWPRAAFRQINAELSGAEYFFGQRKLPDPDDIPDDGAFGELQDDNSDQPGLDEFVQGWT